MKKKPLPVPRHDQTSGSAGQGDEQRYDVGGTVFLVTPVYSQDGENIVTILKKLLTRGM